ncbi:MAG: glutamate--cysteine ligase [Myxococcota bacterium]|jgi:hypothetical protein|nr:glutamate--cysteine ligase [Myxococcota bacterium]
MGIEIDRTVFDAEDRRAFAERLDESLGVLDELLARPGFGAGEASLGAELELSLVGADGDPKLCNEEVLAESGDPRLTVELDRFNLEGNLRYGPLAGASLSALAHECRDCLAEIERAAAVRGARPAMVGILPTLTERHLERDAMTSSLRFEALSKSLRDLRDEPFLLDIHGDDDLHMHCTDVTYEGAATSFQVHLRVAPEDFADVYDAIQLATPAAVAMSGNSPLFLGKRLWHETRIALFKHAVDHRAERGRRGRLARVSFGERWTRAPIDLFREPVIGHTALLPVLDVERPREALAAGRAPDLRELRLHQGTVWRWNRAIYDSADDGHLRIELRALPAGPSIDDMVANAAFLLGVALDVAGNASEWREELDFETVHADFYRAARHGLDARMHWPGSLGGTAGPMASDELIPQLLERADRGLAGAGVDEGDRVNFLGLVQRRVARMRTGASWQREALERAEGTRPRDEAIHHMFRGYLERSRSGAPVADWDPLS